MIWPMLKRKEMKKGGQMIIHKLINKPSPFPGSRWVYLCNQATSTTEGKGSKSWQFVSCKNCLRGFHRYQKIPIEVIAKELKYDLSVYTLEGVMQGKKGDFLVVGIEGETYPVKRSIFEKTYRRKN